MERRRGSTPAAVAYLRVYLARAAAAGYPAGRAPVY
jgi:hypothetical protein